MPLANWPLLAEPTTEEAAVLICRCAWHRTYQGYPLLNGIASWRGWSIRFTDGICDRCLARFRSEHRRLLIKHTDRVAPTASPTEAT
jgi:hypothetical protein